MATSSSGSSALPPTCTSGATCVNCLTQALLDTASPSTNTAGMVKDAAAPADNCRLPPRLTSGHGTQMLTLASFGLSGRILATRGHSSLCPSHLSGEHNQSTTRPWSFTRTAMTMVSEAPGTLGSMARVVRESHAAKSDPTTLTGSNSKMSLALTSVVVVSLPSMAKTSMCSPPTSSVSSSAMSPRSSRSRWRNSARTELLQFLRCFRLNLISVPQVIGLTSPESDLEEVLYVFDGQSLHSERASRLTCI